ncbi:ATP-binding cassette domain-containing protein [Limnochorda pilosa]|uniref:ABC transporter ATP-binding protein n=1 Tax=Limnochorda pilosa TaxID=1555112 RepID=A0A0K2SK21_LIMPI|nr:ATP-binding cassette domain-containing protein [Limnochorda pilosa]BAS27174.1 ABC transporter ATP-binding protein [Limnochorda pilosa]
MAAIIEVEDLRKTYPGGVEAVRGIGFRVEEGEVFGFLGPNGAGKSTTIMMLTTLLRPTAGTLRVAGLDPIAHPARVRAEIGYVSQDLAVDDSLTGRENLRLQGAFYHLAPAEARRRSDELLDLVGLSDRADHRVETYSGGMRKRLDIACGLMHRPRLLFLDEPTLGLDIQTRRQIWAYVGRMKEEFGMTLFLTTHYMEEADALCDRVAIIDRGEVRAIGRPAELKAGIGGDVVSLRLPEVNGASRAPSILQGLEPVRTVQAVDGILQAVVDDGDGALPLIVQALSAQGITPASIAVKKPSLDDVYLAHTGRELREESGSREESWQARVRLRRIRR